MPGITFTEGSGLQDSIYGKCQEPIKMFLEKRGEAFEQASMVKELFLVSPSKNFGEKFTSMTAMDGFQPVGENGAYPADGMQEGFSKFIENMTWKDSFSLSREIVEDGKLMDLKKKPAGFITGYYRTRERFGAALLGSAISGKESMAFSGKAFSCTGADGKCLFHKAHPSALEEEKRVQSNQFSDAFSNDALGAMECQMQDFRGDKGEVLDVAPNTILIPTPLSGTCSPPSARTRIPTPPTTASTTSMAGGRSSYGPTSTSLSPRGSSPGCCTTSDTTRSTAARCGWIG